MGKNIVSSIAFRSNLQLVNGDFRNDRNFLSSIHDPFALEWMKKLGYEAITPIQKKEFRDASLHCAYAFADDYPFGTIVNAKGIQQVVCRCTNVKCSLFTRCRPDFDPSELLVTEENVQFIEKTAEIFSEIKNAPQVSVDKTNGDSKAAASLFVPIEGAEVAQTENSVTEISHKEENDVKQEAPTPVKVEKNISFASFEMVGQKEIIELDPTERTVVNAGPGTGKTWTLIEKIKYMLSDLDTAPENILVLCFSRAAVEVVRNRLEDAANRDELPLNWHEVDVRTFDSFATYLLAWAQENNPDILPLGFALEFANYDKRIQAAVAAIRKFTDVLADYEHVIVDEVQDLVGIRAELVLTLLKTLPASCGFTILGDSCQSLYDYLSVDDNHVMSSGQFYQSVFQEFNTANFYSLAQNYRQGDEFGALTADYRQSILIGDADSRTQEAAKLTALISKSDVNLKRFSLEKARMLTKKGTLGILTRTNGQALQISSWFRTEGVEHILQKPFGAQDLAPWIANVLLNTETDVIDWNEFEKLFGEYYPDRLSSADRYWNALISTQRDLSKRHFEIEELLRGLQQNAKNPLLFEEPRSNPADITISNIHRAKGREFDSVLVLEDVLDAMANAESDDILEHKVCYVALTRPRKSIEKVEFKPQYIYISKDELRRCFRAGGFGNRRYLSHFEIGDSSDIASRTYAESVDTQRNIKALNADERLKLKKCPEGTKSYVVYKVVPEENERIILGYTTAEFARNMERAIQRIYDNNRSIAYKYYPNTFRDIYFDGLTTCVSSSGEGISGAKKIGNMYIWYGLSISGFAQMEKDRY